MSNTASPRVPTAPARASTAHTRASRSGLQPRATLWAAVVWGALLPSASAGPAEGAILQDPTRPPPFAMPVPKNNDKAATAGTPGANGATAANAANTANTASAASPASAPLVVDPNVLVLQTLQVPQQGPATAMVNGRLLQAGDEIAGRTVLSIDEHGVVLGPVAGSASAPAGTGLRSPEAKGTSAKSTNKHLQLLGGQGKQMAGTIAITRVTSFTPAETNVAVTTPAPGPAATSLPSPRGSVPPTPSASTALSPAPAGAKTLVGSTQQ